MDFYHSSANHVDNGVEYLNIRGTTMENGQIAYHIMLRFIYENKGETYVAMNELIELLPRNWTT